MEKIKQMRLSLVARKLNVGLGTIVDHLADKGEKVDTSPNTKLNFEQLEILSKDFNLPELIGISASIIEMPSTFDEKIHFEKSTKEIITSEINNKEEVLKRIKRSKNQDVLNLSNLFLDEIPQEVRNLTKLKKLILRENNIRKIDNLPINLIELELENNQIEVIENLPIKLGLLNIANNKVHTIKEVPTSIVSLNVSFNQLVKFSIPQPLKVLKCESNLLPKIKFTENLISVNLANNKLTEIPNYEGVNSIQELILFGNPIKSVRTEILGTGTQTNCLKALNSYLSELKRKKIKNTKVRLVFIGNSNVGKSTLVASLLGNKTNSIPSTHGAKLHSLKLDNNNEPIHLQIWDLGGQEIYFGTHRMFLLSESVIVLVYDWDTESVSTSPDRLNPSEYMRNIKAQYYLQKIKEISPLSKIIIVENKAELQHPTILNSVYGNNYYPSFRTSVFEEQNLISLKAQIWEEGRRLNVFRMEVPYYWEVVSEHISNISTERKIISKNEFVEICKEKNVLEEGLDELLNYLHNTGILFYKPDLDNEIIIDLTWALKVVYKVFDRDSLFYHEMRSQHTGQTFIRTFFKDFESTDLDLTVEYKWLFYKFLKSTGLCFPLDENENLDTLIVFPEFLSSQKPESIGLWQLKKSKKYTLRKQYRFLPYYPLHSFISNFGKKSSFNKFWRNGILIYTEPKNYAGFLIEANFQNHTLTVEIDESELEWKEAIIDSIEIYDEDNSGDWLIIESIATEIEEFKKKEDLETIDNQLFTLKTQMHRNKIFISYSHSDADWLQKVKTNLKVLKFNDHQFDLWDDTRIKGGDKWKVEIEEALNSAGIAILIVSTDFLASDFIMNDELPIILKNAENNGTIILPLIVRPCRFTKDKHLSIFQSINDPIHPLSSLSISDQEIQLLKLTDRVSEILSE